MLKFIIQLLTPPNRPLIFRNAGNEKKNIVGHHSKHAHLLLARTWKYSTQSMHHSKTLADEKRDQFLTWLTQSLKTHRDATPGSYLHWVGVRATRTPSFIELLDDGIRAVQQQGDPSRIIYGATTPTLKVYLTHTRKLFNY